MEKRKGEEGKEAFWKIEKAPLLFSSTHESTGHPLRCCLRLLLHRGWEVGEDTSKQGSPSLRRRWWCQGLFGASGIPLSLLTLKKRGGRGASRGGGGGGDLVPPPADDDGVGPPADYQIVPPPTVAANVTALMMGGIDHTKRLRFLLLLRGVAGKTPKMFSFFASSFGGEKSRRLLPLPRCNNNGEGGKRRRRKRRRRPMTTSSSPCLSCCRSPKHTGKNGQQAQDAPRTQRAGEKLLSSLPIHRKWNAEYFSSHKRMFPSSVARKGRRRRSRHAQNGTTGIRGVFLHHS